MNYRVIKLPLPDAVSEIESLINQSVPPDHKLIAMTIDNRELILVFGK